MLRIAIGVIIILFSTVVLAGNDPVINLETGKAKGVLQGDVEQYLGLPYALAPVGDRRWAAPVAPATWPDIRDARQFPKRCPQTLKGLQTGLESEDCLYLNIYRPVPAGEKTAKTARAIYVYVHGGGATAGSANDMDGSELARLGDIIVVTINYRLGALGFMNSEVIARKSANGEAGNYALEDVKAALQWVARNAKALGGDPRKITLGGESAGGTVLCPLITAAESRKLFRGAIISSDDCLHDIDSLAQARERALTLVKKLDCDEQRENSFDCLHQKTPEELISVGGFAAPTAEPDSAFALIAQDRWKPMPVLIGANHDEGRIAGPAFYNFDREKFQAWLAKLVPQNTLGKITRVYDGLYAQENNPYPYLISDLITDSGMRGFGGCSSLQAAKNMARRANVYYYEFADPAPPFSAFKDFNFGSAHSAEVAYLWPGSSQPRSAQLTPAQQQLSNQMIRYWANFIKSGNPNGEGLAPWPSLYPAKQYLELLPGQGSQAKNIGEFESHHHCDLWASMPWIMDRGEPGL